MSIFRSAAAITGGVMIAFASLADPAEARCRTVTQSHNGTDFFYADGAAGTAAHKLRLAVAEWQKRKGIKKVRIGKITTKCGGWYIKYMLPHKTCTARARVCY